MIYNKFKYGIKYTIKYNFTMLSLRILAIIMRLDHRELLNFVHLRIGIDNNGTMEETGEKNLIEVILKKYFDPTEKYTFFDIGANNGEYSRLLKANFDKADIYAFEPNPSAYEILKDVSEKENIKSANIGFGENITENKILYSYTKPELSMYGTTNREVLNNYKINDEIKEFSFFSDTLDNYSTNNKIKEIDFIKIDVEGHELYVLKGAKELIKNNKIKIIQFEFSETNVPNRVFLKDFYVLLKDFKFFRIQNGKLINLGFYNSIHEIFCFQNILAIHKDIK